MSGEISIRRLSGGDVKIGDKVLSIEYGAGILTGVVALDVLDGDHIGQVTVATQDYRTGQLWIRTTSTLDAGLLVLAAED
jgi:hypothetical protein